MYCTAGPYLSNQFLVLQILKIRKHWSGETLYKPASSFFSSSFAGIDRWRADEKIHTFSWMLINNYYNFESKWLFHIYPVLTCMCGEWTELLSWLWLPVRDKIKSSMLDKNIKSLIVFISAHPFKTKDDDCFSRSIIKYNTTNNTLYTLSSTTLTKKSIRS